MYLKYFKKHISNYETLLINLFFGGTSKLWVKIVYMFAKYKGVWLRSAHLCTSKVREVFLL